MFETQKLKNKQKMFLAQQMFLLICKILTDKTFKASYFHRYVFRFHLIQSANTEFLLMKAQRVLNRSRKCANVCCRKIQVFYSFAIDLQSKQN